MYLDANHTEVGKKNRVYLYYGKTVGWLRNTALKENGAWTNRTVIVLEHESPAATTNADAESIMFGSYQDPTSAYGITDWVETVFDDFVSANGKLIHICGHSHADYYCTKAVGAYPTMADAIYGFLDTATQKLYKEDTYTTLIDLDNNDLIYAINEKKYYVYHTNTTPYFKVIIGDVVYGYLYNDSFYHDKAHTKPISYLANNATCYDIASYRFYTYGDSGTPHFVLDYERSSKKWLSIHLNCQKMMQADLNDENGWYDKITSAIDINAPVRTPGTATEDCWSVIIVKPRSHEVDVIRFGAGDDRKYDYTNCMKVIDGYLSDDMIYVDSDHTTPISGLESRNLYHDVPSDSYYAYKGNASPKFTRAGYLYNDVFYATAEHTGVITFTSGSLGFNLPEQKYYTYRSAETPHFVPV